jgi:hypothetical protein
MQSNQVVHEFMKNAADKVRAEFSHFKGKDLFSFRVYYQTDEKPVSRCEQISYQSSRRP